MLEVWLSWESLRACRWAAFLLRLRLFPMLPLPKLRMRFGGRPLLPLLKGIVGLSEHKDQHLCKRLGQSARHKKSIFSKLYVFYPELFSTLAQWYGMQLLRIIPLRSYERFSRKTIFVGFRGFLIWGTSVEKLEMSDKCIWPDIHTQRNSMVVPRTCSFFYVVR